MKPRMIAILIIWIFFIQALVWLAILLWMRARSNSLKRKMVNRYGNSKGKFVLEPQQAQFRGSDARFGNTRGNGIICLTERGLIFEKLTGQKIELDRAEISGATVENSFKGKLSVGTGGKHLVLKTRDGNRVGFLLKDAVTWSEMLDAK